MISYFRNKLPTLFYPPLIRYIWHVCICIWTWIILVWITAGLKTEFRPNCNLRHLKWNKCHKDRLTEERGHPAEQTQGRERTTQQHVSLIRVDFLCDRQKFLIKPQMISFQDKKQPTRWAPNISLSLKHSVIEGIAEQSCSRADGSWNAPGRNTHVTSSRCVLLFSK